MHSKINKLIPFLAFGLFLSSCGDTSSSLKINTYNSSVSISINSNEEKAVINPNDVTLTSSLYKSEENSFFNYQRLPSTGDINLLVIPTLLPGYKEIDLNNDGISDNEKVLKDLDIAFNSPNEAAYESLYSYYYKSSYGKLNLKSTITPWFDYSLKDSTINNAAEIDVEDTEFVVEKAIEWAKEQGYKMSDYDNDKDGYIDGVWLIYSCPNYTNDGPHTDNTNYWAYTSWGNIDPELYVPSTSDPIYNLYGWASYDFMYTYGKDKVDAHTYIHETGHFMGLNDYYSDQRVYNPVGKMDMMDANIIDHNSYSKMLLGWSKPYIVTGSCNIDLKSMENENSFIVIPSNDEEIINNEFNPFSEYILIEYYTPEGLNEFDITNKNGESPLAINEKGVRIYHIDNRKFKVSHDEYYNYSIVPYEGESLIENEYIVTPITNNRNYDVYNYGFDFEITNNLFDEIRLIEKHNEDTFSFGGKQSINTLFKKDDVFSLAKYGKNFFVNENSFNNGSSFTYEITIGEER